MKITLAQISKERMPCKDGLAWFNAQEDKDLISLVKAGIKGSKETMRYINWGLCAVMTKAQQGEYIIYAARQVEHLWKDKHPKEYAVWNKWASSEDRSDEKDKRIMGRLATASK